MSSHMTAMDVENQEFRRKMRGYDPEQVDLFLTSVSDEIERLNLERSEMREEMGRMRVEVEKARSREGALQKTLVTAQAMTEDLKKTAAKESEMVLREAQLRADSILQDAKERLARLDTEVSRAAMERETVERRLRGVLEQHLALLEMRRAEREDPDNLRVLPSRAGSEVG